MPDVAVPGAATVHEAYGRRGALPSAIKPVHDAFRVYGPAFPVDCAPGDNLWIHRAIYACAPGDVLVVDVGGAAEAGYWGEILSRAALVRGVGGLVIAGGVRDIAEIASIGLPVFAANVCLRGTSKSPSAGGQLGSPIRIGEVSVGAGDLVVGDRDGVVVVAAAEADEVMTGARAREAAERDILRRILDGESTLQIFGLDAAPPPG